MNLILGLVDVNRTDDRERFLGFEIERPRFVHLGFQPVSHRAVLAFKRRRYSSITHTHERLTTPATHEIYFILENVSIANALSLIHI